MTLSGHPTNPIKNLNLLDPNPILKSKAMAEKKNNDGAAPAEAETNTIKADPELVAAKIAAGLDKDQAEEVALAQAAHDAALGKKK